MLLFTWTALHGSQNAFTHVISVSWPQSCEVGRVFSTTKLPHTNIASKPSHQIGKKEQARGLESNLHGKPGAASGFQPVTSMLVSSRWFPAGDFYAVPPLLDVWNGIETAYITEMQQRLSDSYVSWLVHGAWGELRPVQILRLLWTASLRSGFHCLRNPFMVSGPAQRHYLLET